MINFSEQLEYLPDIKGLSGGTSYKKDIYPSMGEFLEKGYPICLVFWDMIFNNLDYDDDADIAQYIWLRKEELCTIAHIDISIKLNELILPNKIDIEKTYKYFVSQHLEKLVLDLLRDLKSDKYKQCQFILSNIQDLGPDLIHFYEKGSRNDIGIMSTWVQITTIDKMLKLYREFKTSEEIISFYKMITKTLIQQSKNIPIEVLVRWIVKTCESNIWLKKLLPDAEID